MLIPDPNETPEQRAADEARMLLDGYTMWRETAEMWATPDVDPIALMEAVTRADAARVELLELLTDACLRRQAKPRPE